MPQSKTIFISGCSTGIGYTTAVALKKRGHRVICSARKEADILKLQKEGFEALLLNLADSNSVQKAAQQLLKLCNNKIDGLFNNAAFGQPGAVEDLSRAVLTAQFETNVFGTHELTHLIIPAMRQQGYGRIIYNSSILGFVAMKYRGAYSASKFALEGLADTLRLELHDTSIKICLIEPGPIASHFRKNAFSAFKLNINTATSVHSDVYKAMEQRLQQESPVQPFTLPATAVAKKVMHALESERPKIRYYVTWPTYLFAYLKRLLPATWLDVLLRKIP